MKIDGIEEDRIRLRTPRAPIETFNKFMVAANGRGILIMSPPRTSISHDEALVLAAYLVSLAIIYLTSLALAAILVVGVTGWLWNGDRSDNLEVAGGIGNITSIVNQKVMYPESISVRYPPPEVQHNLASIYKANCGVIDTRVSDNKWSYRNVAAGSEDGFATWRLLFNVTPIYSKVSVVRHLGSAPSPKISINETYCSFRAENLGEGRAFKAQDMNVRGLSNVKGILRRLGGSITDHGLLLSGMSRFQLSSRLGNYLIHRSLKIAITSLKGIPSELQCFSGSFCGLPHLIQLTRVNESYPDVNQYAEYPNSNKPSFPVFYLPQLSAIVSIAIGGICSWWGWWILVSDSLNWQLTKRLVRWFLFNILAAVFVWHGGALLLGV